MPMTIQIRQTSVLWDDNGEASLVQVHFHGYNKDRSINFNGYIPLSIEEHEGKTLAELTGIVRQNLSDRLTEVQ